MRRLLWTGMFLLPWIAAIPAFAQGTDVVLFENFDGVTAPGFPSGWLATPSSWETSSSSPSNGSGGNNAMNRGSVAGELRLPAVNLSGASSGVVTYRARRTASYDQTNLALTASVDGGSSFSVVVIPFGSGVPEATSVYQVVVADLPPVVLGEQEVFFRFESAGNSSSTANARIDDVEIAVERPVLVSPSSLHLTVGPGEVTASTISLQNFSGAPLLVGAPSHTGGPFSIQPQGSVIVAHGSAQQYDVAFAPQVDGDFEASLTFPHEHGGSVVQLSGTTRGGRFGFGTSTSVVAMDEVAEIPLLLEFSNIAGIHGLQFEAAWTDPALEFLGVERGTSIQDASAWSLSYESGESSVRSVLLASGVQSLAPGRYEPLMLLRFAHSHEPTAAADSVQIVLVDVIGALAVADGLDANLVAEPDRHTVYLGAREAGFVADPPAISFPDVQVGDSMTVMLTVSNPGGTIPLIIGSVTSSNPLFRVLPDTAVVEPDGATTFAVGFVPTFTDFGDQVAVLRFAHNANEEGTDSLTLSARGVGGRGDVDRDGYVDAVDVVHVVDFVLGRGSPVDRELASGDVYPFPEGDEILDVRDLTVLSHAIVHEAWPDDVPTPSLPGIEASQAPPFVAGEGGVGSGGVIEISDAWTLRLRSDVPVRALHVTLAASEVASVTAVSPANDEVPPITLFAHDNERIRIVAYRADGESIEPGQHHLVKIEPKNGGGTVRPVYVIGVGEDRKRVPITLVGSGSEGDENEVPGSALGLGLAFPNPVRFAAGQWLRLPLVGRADGSRGRAAVYNILGQRVRLLDAVVEGETVLEWDGRDQSGGLVLPGIYFVRLEGVAAATRSVVVVP